MTLTRARLLEVVEYDSNTGIFVWCHRRGGDIGEKICTSKYAGKIAGGITSFGYWRLSIDRRYYQAHRLAWLYVHGEWPKAVIDHADGNKLNNAIANLREASVSENAANSVIRKDNTSGFKGVYLDKRIMRWSARLRVDGRYKALGYFGSAQEASAAYDAASQAHFGKFARLS